MMCAVRTGKIRADAVRMKMCFVSFAIVVAGRPCIAAMGSVMVRRAVSAMVRRYYRAEGKAQTECGCSCF